MGEKTAARRWEQAAVPLGRSRQGQPPALVVSISPTIPFHQPPQATAEGTGTAKKGSGVSHKGRALLHRLAQGTSPVLTSSPGVKCRNRFCPHDPSIRCQEPLKCQLVSSRTQYGKGQLKRNSSCPQERWGDGSHHVPCHVWCWERGQYRHQHLEKHLSPHTRQKHWCLALKPQISVIPAQFILITQHPALWSSQRTGLLPGEWGSWSQRCCLSSGLLMPITS